MKNYQFKIYNGTILSILKRHGLNSISDSLLGDILEDLKLKHVLPDTHDHLMYLSGKGKEYINVEDIIEHGIKRKLIKLTPRGVDLLYGLIEDDPGVSIDCEKPE
jgi:hypothetical protein